MTPARWESPNETPRWESAGEVIATAACLTIALTLAVLILPLWALIGAAVTGIVLWRAT